jgi:hypothetical protein
MNEEPLVLEDMGDATKETKQHYPIGPFFDSLYGHGDRQGFE